MPNLSKQFEVIGFQFTDTKLLVDIRLTQIGIFNPTVMVGVDLEKYENWLEDNNKFEVEHNTPSHNGEHIQRTYIIGWEEYKNSHPEVVKADLKDFLVGGGKANYFNVCPCDFEMTAIINTLKMIY